MCRDTTMYNMKCMVILGIIGATGIITKGVEKNFEVISWKRLIELLQNTAILGTSHIIWKVLQSETWSLSSGDYLWFKRRSTRKIRLVTRDDDDRLEIFVAKAVIIILTDYTVMLTEIVLFCSLVFDLRLVRFCAVNTHTKCFNIDYSLLGVV